MEDSSGLRLLHVHAHPDDESSKGAATTAYYVAQGVRVMVATCTGGERGSILNRALDTPENWARLPDLRREEMAEAARVLGIEHVWLGFTDSGLPEGDPLPPLPEGCFALEDVDRAAGRLVKVIREFRPQVVTTYDENGGYPHPDHVMCHRVTMAAVAAASDPEAWPEHGEPWEVSKVYYDLIFHRQRFAGLDAAMHEAGLERPYHARLSNWAEAPNRLTTFIPCAGYFDVRDAALRAHATQVDPDGPWFAVPVAVQVKGWPTEDYQLVHTLVETSLPEDDLFAGLRPAAGDSVEPWSYSI
ncbi:MAG: mycothiol conjugate amidase Mca [Propionicimonas sp.]